jgi:hypothetical protein
MMRVMIFASKACSSFEGGGGRHLMEDCGAVPMDAVEHQAVQMNIQIGG